MGVGYPDTPGIWSPEQVEGWKTSPRPSTTRAGGSSCSSGTSGGCRTRSTWTGAAGRPERDPPPAATSACCGRSSRSSTPRALELERDPRRHRGLPQGGRERPGRRLRRRRDPRGQRLPARPVPPGRHQPPDRRLRRPDREPGPAAARGHRRRHLGLGAGPGRHAPGPARRRPLDGRLRPGGDVRLRRPGARQAADRVPLRPRVRWARAGSARAEGGVRRRLHRQREVHPGDGRAGARAPARPTPSPSACCSSPTPTCPAGSRWTPR